MIQVCKRNRRAAAVMICMSFVACTHAGKVGVKSVVGPVDGAPPVRFFEGLDACIAEASLPKTSDSNWAGDTWKVGAVYHALADLELSRLRRQANVVYLIKEGGAWPESYDLCVARVIELKLDAGTFFHDCRAKVTLEVYGRNKVPLLEIVETKSASQGGGGGPFVACQKALDKAVNGAGKRLYAGLPRERLIRPAAQPDDSTEATTPKLVPIPGGPAMLGCNPSRNECHSEWDAKRRMVQVAPFLLDNTEVTVGDYGACVRAGACSEPLVGGQCNYARPGYERHPVNCVTWEQASFFCTWAGKRLPTPEEWEKAARGTDERRLPWGEGQASKHANTGDLEDGHVDTAPVGSYTSGASPYGALDMVGNVWEWVNGKELTGGVATGRPIRGHSFRSKTEAVTVYRHIPGRADADVGFRCARSP